jgi:hypothetical protein
MSDQAKRIIKYETESEQALMMVATSLSGRAIDLDDVVSQESNVDLSSRFRTLDSLVF